LASKDIFSALAVPNFRWLWIGSLGSSFAMNMQIIARGWLVYSLTSSAMDLAWVTLSFMLPSVFYSPCTVACSLTVCPSAKSLSARNLSTVIATSDYGWPLSFAEAVTFWDFIWFGFFNGTILALSMPSRHAFVPELIPEKLIFTAMALNTTGWNLSRIIGPALGWPAHRVARRGRQNFLLWRGHCLFGHRLLLYFMSAVTDAAGGPPRFSLPTEVRPVPSTKCARGYFM